LIQKGAGGLKGGIAAICPNMQNAYSGLANSHYFYPHY
jgi:hypothetical protein